MIVKLEAIIKIKFTTPAGFSGSCPAPVNVLLHVVCRQLVHLWQPCFPPLRTLAYKGASKCVIMLACFWNDHQIWKYSHLWKHENTLILFRVSFMFINYSPIAQNCNIANISYLIPFLEYLKFDSTYLPIINIDLVRTSFNTCIYNCRSNAICIAGRATWQ